MKQHAKFFCENCGAEVPQNAKFCRHCGRFFSSVRCPVCGTTGTPDQFENGCPNCGYAVGKSDVKNSGKQKKENVRLSRESKKNIAAAFERYSLNNGAVNGKRKGDESLPFWMYFITIFALAVIILCIFTYLSNR